MAVDFKDYMNRPLTLTTAEKFISNFKRYKNVFPENILKQAIRGYRVGDFATNHYCPVENSRYYESKYPRHTPKSVYYTFKEYKGEWEKEVRKPAYGYIIPDNYQLKESEILKKALFLTCPDMEVLNWDIYHFDRDSSDVYLKTSYGSVYCPIIALVEGNIENIVKRHTDYHKDFYNSADCKQYLDRALSCLETTEFKILCKILKHYKKRKAVTYTPEETDLIAKNLEDRRIKAITFYLRYEVCPQLKLVYVIDKIDFLIEDGEEYAMVTANNSSFKVKITDCDKAEILVNLNIALRLNTKIKTKGEI